MARTIKLDTITHPSNSGTANQTLDSSGQTAFPTVDINGGSLDNVTIGATTAGAGTFSSVTSPTVKAGTGNFIVQDSGGNTAITVDSSGNTTLEDNVTIKGNTTIGDATSDTLTITATADGSNNRSGITGEIRMYATSSAPTGWLVCNGSAVNTFTYKTLHAIVSNTYGGTAFNAGVTDQSGANTTFNLPDFRGRVAIGVNGESNLSGRGSKALAASGGADTHTLTQGELAAHTHTGPSHDHSFSATTGDGGSHYHLFTGDDMPNYSDITRQTSNVGNYDATSGSGSQMCTYKTSTVGNHDHSVSGTTGSAGTGATGSTGSGSAHNNLQPYLTVNYIIKT